MCSMAADERRRVQTEVEHEWQWISQDFHSNFIKKAHLCARCEAILCDKPRLLCGAAASQEFQKAPVMIERLLLK